MLPLAFVGYATTPFVAALHIRLPPFARQSAEVLRRYVRSGAPAPARLEITTMNLVGRPRVAEVAVADLRAVRGRFGLANFARYSPRGPRPWYRRLAVLPPATRFHIPLAGGTAREGWVWTELAAAIAKRSASRGK